MDGRIYELMKKNDMGTPGAQLAFQCAPFIMGIKPSNLFIIGNKGLSDAVRLLERGGYSYFVLHSSGLRTALLLYDGKALGELVAAGRTAGFLRGLGYFGTGLLEMLGGCRIRYRQYMSGQRDFPHELGVFLGYPLEDVEGFISNHGKNSLYTSYWKVYHDLPAKLALFEAYDEARRELLERVYRGSFPRG